MLAEFINRADVGMLQCRGRARFALEALQRHRVARQRLRQELHGDAAAQLEVFRGVDHPHPAAPEDLQNAVVGNDLAGHGLWRQVPDSAGRGYPGR